VTALEVVFTLRRLPNMTDDEFARDARLSPPTSLGSSGCSNQRREQTREPTGSQASTQRRDHVSRIFQKLSLRTIAPPSPNVEYRIRTSMHVPSVVVPLIVHSDTPRFPQTKVVLAIVDIWNAFEARRQARRTSSFPTNRRPTGHVRGSLKPRTPLRSATCRVEIVAVEAVQHLPKHCCPVCDHRDLLWRAIP
jgi:hypothetical protein